MSEQAQEGKALLSIPHGMFCLLQLRCYWLARSSLLANSGLRIPSNVYNRLAILHSFDSGILQHTELQHTELQLILNLAVVRSVAFCCC